MCWLRSLVRCGCDTTLWVFSRLAEDVPLLFPFQMDLCLIRYETRDDTHTSMMQSVSASASDSIDVYTRLFPSREKYSCGLTHQPFGGGG